MPAPKPEDSDQEDLSSARMQSVETSVPSSPTDERPLDGTHRSRFMLPSSSDLTSRLAGHQQQDERTPLLTGQSRIRIAEGTTTPRARLSRHHSYAGMSGPVLPLPSRFATTSRAVSKASPPET